MIPMPSSKSLARRDFMIGITGMTFAIVAGEVRLAGAATEGPIAAGTAFNPWVSISSQRRNIDHRTGYGNGTGIVDRIAPDPGRGIGRRLVQGGHRARPTIDKICGNPGFGGVMRYSEQRYSGKLLHPLASPLARKYAAYCSITSLNIGTCHGPNSARSRASSFI